MASALKNLSEYDESNMPDASDMSFGIVVSDYHNDITYKLYEGAFDTLIKHGAKEENIHIVQVPGAFELTSGARILVNKHKVDAVMCLGCVIKGETPHNDYINAAVAQGLTNLSIATGFAFLYGLLTPNTHQQALDRAGGKHGNKGIEAAQTAIRMAALKKEKGDLKKSIGFQ